MMILIKKITGTIFSSLKWFKAKRLAKLISKVDLIGQLDGEKNLHDFLLNFRSRDKPLFFFDKSVSSLLEDYFKKIGGTSKAVIECANQICTHTFDLLGGEMHVDREGKIDWHKDFKSGMKWETGTFYTDTAIVKGDGSDIKVPWELSRFQHLPTLGKAYWLTEDKKYAQEFVSQINDWIDSNPPQYGVNWTCTMDIAIRAVNWIWGYYFFKDSPEVTDEFLLKFLKSLFIHGKHISANLERNLRGVNTNHYLSDIVGLLYLGLMFPEFKEAKKLRVFGTGELIKGMERQVYPDGVDYEGSISYHRLVTELFLSATLLGLMNGVAFPNWYMRRLEKMIEFVMYYTKPDGTAPQIGDNDDGRLHILADYRNWNRLGHRYLLSTGAALFNSDDFKQAAGSLHEETFWLLGEEGIRNFKKLPDKGYRVSSRAFPDGGFYIMRTNSLYMISDCVPSDSKSPSGHKHNSRLSFELFAHDKSFIIDPGAYIYTADKYMRNLFRNTKYHNTVVVDGGEQNRFDEDDLFNMRRDAMVTVNRWQVSDEYDLLDAEHGGYRRFKNPVTHRRCILFNKQEGYWIVEDLLTGEGEHQFDLYFHLSPLEIEFDREFPLVVKTRAKGANLAIIPLEDDGVSAENLEGWISYRYGVKVKAPIIKYSKKSYTPTRFNTVLYPFTGKFNVAEAVDEVHGSKIGVLWEAKNETGF